MRVVPKTPGFIGLSWNWLKDSHSLRQIIEFPNVFSDFLWRRESACTSHDILLKNPNEIGLSRKSILQKCHSEMSLGLQACQSCGLEAVLAVCRTGSSHQLRERALRKVIANEERRLASIGPVKVSE